MIQPLVSLFRPLSILLALACAALGSLLSGCASAPSPRFSGPAAGPGTVGVEGDKIEYLEQRALLLLLADRRTYEPVSISAALEASPELRRQAALTLGRIGDPRGGPILRSLLADPDLTVRRAAAFALGELGESAGGNAQTEGNIQAAASALLGMLGDEDRETGRLAVEGLAKMGVTVESVVERLIQGSAAEFLPRLLPSLYRFQSREEPSSSVVRWAAQGLDEEGLGAHLHAMAAYALARTPVPEGAPHLRGLLTDGDPWVRGWGARGLGEVGDRTDFDRLAVLLSDPEPGPIIQALRALGSLISAGRAAPSQDLKPRLLELLSDPRAGVRVTAIEASVAWLLDDDLSERLIELAANGHPKERQLALLALARGQDSRAVTELMAAAEDSNPMVRGGATRAAGFLGEVEVLDVLSIDEHATVRAAALETWLTAEPPDVAERITRALADRDAGVRTVAFEWLSTQPVVSLEALVDGMWASRRDRILDARLAGIRALAARAEAEPLERGALMAVLEELARDDEILIRRQAINELAALGGEAMEPGGLNLRKPIDLYREVVRRTASPQRVELRTDRGTVMLELACPEAPMTCLNFLQLGGQGFYDGLAFHRVVPDFVVQGGDPRGDGRGGPGYTLRDEMNLLRYDRGSVGMALSGPDTGGSQFFITLSPQPHLDGGYTVFGRVVSGLEILDTILEGDRILGVVAR